MFPCSHLVGNDHNIRRPRCPKFLRAFICSLDSDNPLRFQVVFARKPMSSFVESAQRHTAVLRHCYLNNAATQTWMTTAGCHAHCHLFTLTVHQRHLLACASLRPIAHGGRIDLLQHSQKSAHMSAARSAHATTLHSLSKQHRLN